ncbi:nuclear transport factor 2 family protein [Novosphingobium sp. M1R2S20]|uniref:Nuclear transport factor 2 family protein n=1 Tax=Novosphingobium rhizovicinum TaxID=3228928 RepID=A0ABV3RF24_9SPHN
MSIEDRLTMLENRLRAAEDQLEILRLLNTYGPAVDSGSAEIAADLWTEDGIYDAGGVTRFTPDALIKMYNDVGHQNLVHTGSSHLTATPRIEVHGDQAEAVAYSFVVVKRDDEWFIMRGAINHWQLVRTAQGWRIKERFNRVLDGTSESHEVMRRALPS